ncbi:MAG: hypothetical protein K8R63_03030 [Bacteroidales bacterium]|nr:hypothetical protein [Bacteroidales bacterium]
MKKASLIIGLLIVLLSLPGIAQVKTIWKDTRFLKEPMQKLLVIVQFNDRQLRESLEEGVLTAFRDRGISAVSGQGLLIYDSMFYYSTIERKLDSAEVDGMLILKMVDAESTDMYVMAPDVLPPYAYNYYEYYSFYYYHDLPVIIDPNYYRRPGKTYRIDVNLYQNKGDMISWGGQSKSFDPLMPDKLTKTLGKRIVKKLLSEKMISAEKY